jgi:rRNA maturation endonuclease Nob1
MAETDRIKADLATGLKPVVVVPAASPKKNACPSCGATFDKPLKFCGECGKPMGGLA